MRKCLVLGVALCILAWALPALAVPSYTVNVIPVPSDVYGNWSYLNDHGLAAGYTMVDGNHHAAILDTLTGAITDLHHLLPGAVRSKAGAINNSGQVTGDWIDENDICHAFSWKLGSGLVDLGAFGGEYTSAGGLNEAGEIVGNAMDAAFTGMYAVQWDARRGMRNLRRLSNVRSGASDINNYGQIVGSYSSGDDRRAFIWDKSHGMVDLGIVGEYNAPSAINDYGQVIGRSTTPEGDWCGWVWNPSTGMGTLPPLNGNFGLPNCINEAGQIVGGAEKLPGWTVPVLWESGAIVEINSLIDNSQWELGGVSSINNKGWMLGGAWSRADDNLYLCLLKPVGISFVMDIMPGDRENKIRPGAKQAIPVALIVDEDFDPTTVDLSSISMAGAPVAGRKAKMQDVNKDKVKDLVISIDSSKISLTPSDEPITVTLTGLTNDGTPITAKGLVMVTSVE